MTPTPKLPSVRELARRLRALHEADFAEFVSLELTRDGERFWSLVAVSAFEMGDRFGREYVPGHDETYAHYDATADARRLLSDARQGLADQRAHSGRKGR